jgi:ribosomal protein S18 acetylase RimI-like enzyme
LAEIPDYGLLAQAFIQLYSQQSDFADGNTIAYLYGLRVKPRFRNQGIGTSLMQTIEADLARRGFHRLTLNVGRENRSAFRLYRRLGYRVVSADPGRWSYIDHKGLKQTVDEPAWRMEKILK